LRFGLVSANDQSTNEEAIPSVDAPSEYLVSHGKSGGFGRFRAVEPLVCQRGDRVVVRSARGFELGVVMCPATARHAHLLKDRSMGELLRRATSEDEQRAELLRQHSQCLFEDTRRSVSALSLPLEVLDAEILLDGRSAIIQHLRWADCDLEPLVQTLSHQHDLTLLMEDLALPGEPEESHGGCGQPNCGRAQGGACSSCGSDGGCSSCGSGKVDLRAYFAHLRTKMEENPQRIPLA
jgi:hypothetical protein